MQNRKNNRQSVRGKYYNYENNGFYFITICCDRYINYLGKIENNKLKKSKMGIIVEKYLLKISKKFDFIKLYEYVIMPNHIHVIFIINDKKQSFGPWGTIDHYAGRSGICYYDSRFDDGGVVVKNFMGAKLDNVMGMAINNSRGAELDNVMGMAVNNSRGVACNAPTKAKYYSQISPKKGELGTIIRSFKSAVTNYANKNNILFKWQRNYYEHIIRNGKSLINISNYIKNNPKKWASDRNNR